MCILMNCAMLWVALLMILGAEALNISIGGLFDLYDSSGNIDRDQVQYLSAFLMAVDEINNKTDGIYDDLLPDVHLNVVVRNTARSPLGTAKGVQDLLEASVWSDPALRSVVSAVPDDGVSIANALLTEAGVLQVFGVANDTSLGFTSLSPNRISTVPLQSFDGKMLQHAFCIVYYQKVVVFSDNSLFGEMSAFETGTKTYCGVEVLATISFVDGVTDFGPYINSAKALDATVYVFYCSARSASMIMEQGFKSGLFMKHNQFVAGSNLLDESLWTSMSSEVDPGVILKGLVVVKYSPEVPLLRAAGQSFMERWRALPSTVGGGVGSCVNDVDDSDDQFPLFKVKGSGECMGLDYSSFPQNGTTIAALVLNVYDAVIALAMGYNITIANGTFSNITSDVSVLQNAIIDDVAFDGVSGVVDFFEGSSDFGGFGRGSRQRGNHYGLWNFQSDQYQIDPKNAMVYFGNWSFEHGVYQCFMDPAIPNCGYLQPSLNSDGTWVRSWAPFTLSPFPSVVKLGVLMPPVVDPVTKEVNTVAVEHLAAIKLAIDQINNKSDGYFDDILPSSLIVLAVETATDSFTSQTSAYKLINEVFGGSTLHGAIVLLEGELAEAGAAAFKAAKIPQVGTLSRASFLAGSSENYDFVSLLPTTSYDGVVLQDISCNHFRYRKMVVIASANSFGTQALNAFKADTYCKKSILGTLVIGSGDTDQSNNLRSLRALNARVFVIFLNAEAAARVIESGYDVGLFGNNMQILLSVNDVPGSPSVVDYFSPSADVAQMMRGVVMVQYSPGEMMQSRDNSVANYFHEAWSSQPPTMSTDSFGNVSCISAYDDADNTFLYHEPLGLTTSVSDAVCAGLNFSKYDRNASNPLVMSGFAGHAYDSILVFSIGVHHVILSGETYSASAFEASCEANVDFQGVSGHIDIPAGDPNNAYYGKGVRTTDSVFKIVNFNSVAYHANISEGFLELGVWGSKYGGSKFCDPSPPNVCSEPVYNSDDSSQFPADAPPPITVEMSREAAGILYFLAFTILFVSFYCFWFVDKYRSHRIIMTSQPQMLHVISFGGVCSGIKTLMNAIEGLSAITCKSNVWLGHTAFWLMLSTLLLKSWRVDRIVNNKSLVRVKITLNDVLLRLGIIMGLVILFEAIIIYVGKPHFSSSEEEVDNQVTIYPVCQAESNKIEVVLYIIEAATLAWGARLSHATKDVPAALNESKSIAQAITVIVLIGALVFPVMFLLDIDVLTREVIGWIAFCTATLLVMFIIFTPKILAISEGAEVDENLKIVSAADKIGVEKSSSMSNSDKGHRGAANSYDNATLRKSLSEKRSKSRSYSVERTAAEIKESNNALPLLFSDVMDEMAISHNQKYQLVREQIEQWKSMLVLLELDEQVSDETLSKHRGTIHPESPGQPGDSAPQFAVETIPEAVVTDGEMKTITNRTEQQV